MASGGNEWTRNFKKIHRKAAGVIVHLGWIPAHVGISKIQDADKHAKEMTARVAKGLTGVDNKTAFPAAIKIAQEDINSSLANKMEQSPSWRYYYRQLIPKVTTRTIFPDTRFVGFSCVRLR